MVCSYCQTRNTPTAVVCSHCGIILRIQHLESRAPRFHITRSAVMRWSIVAGAALISGSVGWWLVHYFPETHISHRRAAAIGAVIGGVLLYLVSGARVILFTLIHRNRLKSVNGRMRHVLSHAEEKYEKDLQDKN